MNKEQYFEISVSKKLPQRCPLLNVCQRRAFSIWLFSFRGLSTQFWENELQRAGELSDKYNNDKVEMQGESASWIGGSNYYSFHNVCQEIHLFENEHHPVEVSRVACCSGNFDKDRTVNKFQSTEFRHFSECTEFSFYSYNKSKKMSEKNTRKKISNKFRAELQKEINSACPFCTSDDVGHFEGHHIDGDPSNTVLHNLLLICPTCHSKIEKGDIAQLEVYKKKIELITQPKKLIKKEATKVIKFKDVGNAVVGDGNTITINTKKIAAKQKYPPGCIGYESDKANYIGHLIQRFNEYKEYEVGKEGMRYHVFGALLKKKFNIPTTRTIYNLQTEKFEELYSFIQSRIDGTKLAKVKGRGHKNYSSFEEFLDK